MPRLINPVPSRIHPINDLTDENRDDRGEGLKTATGLSDSAVVTGTKAATGYIAFSGIPVDADTITVNGVVFTFKDTPVAGTDIDIKTTAATQATEVASVLNASVNASVDDATYAAVSGQVTVTHDTLGSGGNAFTLAESATNTTVSGATLTGGVSESYTAYNRVVKNFMHG